MDSRRIGFSWKKEKEILEQKDYSYRYSGCIENVWRIGFVVGGGGEVALQALQIIYRAANWNKNPPVAFGFSKLTILSYVPTVSEKDRDKRILCQIFSSTSKPIVSCFQSFRGIRDDFRGVRKWLIFTLPRITKNIALCLWTTRFLFGSGNRTQNVNSKKD